MIHIFSGPYHLNSHQHTRLSRYRICFFCCFIIGIVTGLPSCIMSQKMMDNINGHYYKYTFAVREATTRKKSADFEKDGVLMHFDPQYNRVNFDLKNNSNLPVSIEWNKTLIIMENDSSYVLHSGVPLGSRSANLQPTVVAAGAQYSDFILPLDLIQTVDDHQTIKDIYAEKDDALSVKTDWIMGQIGKDVFAVQFTIKLGEQLYVLPFHFYPIVMQRGAKSFKPQYSKATD